MSDWKETLAVGITVGLALAFASSVLFAMGSAFIAFGWWMLRLAGIAA